MTTTATDSLRLLRDFEAELERAFDTIADDLVFEIEEATVDDRDLVNNCNDLDEDKAAREAERRVGAIDRAIKRVLGEIGDYEWELDRTLKTLRKALEAMTCDATAN